jgi:hypothetical protein
MEKRFVHGIVRIVQTYVLADNADTHLINQNLELMKKLE